MKTRTMKLMSLAALATGLVLAQGGGQMDPAAMVQMRVDRMNEQLKLSKTQQTQATTIFTGVLGTNQSVQGGMREANQALAAAIKAGDEAAISQAANTIGTLTAQITVNNAKAEMAFYKTLTPDQQAKYTPGAGGMRGMGGGGGQGGGRRGQGAPPQE